MNSPFEKELIGREKAFWRAMKDKDVEAAKRLTNDECILTGAQGVSRIERDKFADMMGGADWEIHDFDIADIEVARISDDVAIIGYKVRERLTVNGKPVSLEVADSSTWVKKDGEWLCAMHTEAIAGDPFGRDRTSQ